MMEDREIIENEENAECEIVKEVRETRHKISARFNHDVGQVVAHYQALEKKMRQSGKYRFVDLPNETPKLSKAKHSDDHTQQLGTKQTSMLHKSIALTIHYSFHLNKNAMLTEGKAQKR